MNTDTFKHPITERPINLLLRLEGLAIFAVATFAYGALSANWLAFALLFLLPDLSALGYLINKRIGAWSYNLVHNYLGPLIVGVLSWAYAPSLLPYVLIWAAHIGIDRAVGYGLKSNRAFKETHLSR